MARAAEVSPGSSGEAIGIVGLGQIGAAIANRYRVCDVAVTVFDVRSDVVDDAVTIGARPAADLAELASIVDVVLIAVRHDAQVLAVLDDLLPHIRPGAIVAVLATVTPETIATAVTAGEDFGVTVVDAPLAGQGASSIERGTMSVLVGGDAAAVARIRDAVEPFGRVVHTGEVGTGAVLKLAHNVMVYGGYAAAIEAVRLATAAGVRVGLVEEITQATGTLSEQTAIFLDIYQRRAGGHRSPELDEIMRISAALLDKDLRHAIALGGTLGIPMPVSSVIAGTGTDIYVADRDDR